MLSLWVHDACIRTEDIQALRLPHVAGQGAQLH